MRRMGDDLIRRFFSLNAMAAGAPEAIELIRRLVLDIMASPRPAGGTRAKVFDGE
jgi:hypothetical protein